jgi:drug/metabolite transporter (DMT)-like permease
LYGLEGNVVARWGTYGADAVQVLLGASLVGAVMVLPLALLSGQFIDPRGPWGRPDLALMASSCVHAVVYTSYVWLVGRAGSVFAAQVSYIVTVAGVGWAMVLLGERYSGGVWLAMLFLLAGVFLVQPRPKGGLVAASANAKV